ncbi:MAG: hypothetical protein PHF35_05170 [Candidatus Moranbacteria bacterium]|nr:hypothetical protein [Candidatus Moranbacteria bacterium]
MKLKFKKFKVTERGINFLLIFILGFLVGAALKSEAQKRVTIGFNDYLVPKYRQDINPMAVSPDATPNGSDSQTQPDQENGNPSQDQNSPAGQESAPSGQ